VEKVLAHKNRLTKASASEKVGKALEYQIVCLIVQEKLACKWSAKITIKENNPSSVGVVRAIDCCDRSTAVFVGRTLCSQLLSQNLTFNDGVVVARNIVCSNASDC
jgi:hypothetical protein